MGTGYTKARLEARRAPGFSSPNLTLAELELEQAMTYVYNDPMCYFCGEAVILDRAPGSGETCPTCGKDMHVCLMCLFWDPQARFACRETIDSQILDKDRRNFCDWFALNPAFGVKGRGDKRGQEKEGKAKLAFDSLFKAP